MWDAIIGIGQVLEALIRLRYMFAGILIGSGLGYVYEELSGDVVGDPIYVTVAVCALVGLILDIRRGLKRDKVE